MSDVRAAALMRKAMGKTHRNVGRGKGDSGLIDTRVKRSFVV